MKLRNKKRGEVFYAAFNSGYGDDRIAVDVVEPVDPVCSRSYYGSLKELCEEWEDYEPKEPDSESVETIKDQDSEPVDATKGQDAINRLRSESAYLMGKVEAYEKFLKGRGYIKEEEQ